MSATVADALFVAALAFAVAVIAGYLTAGVGRALGLELGAWLILVVGAWWLVLLLPVRAFVRSAAI